MRSVLLGSAYGDDDGCFPIPDSGHNFGSGQIPRNTLGKDDDAASAIGWNTSTATRAAAGRLYFFKITFS